MQISLINIALTRLGLYTFSPAALFAAGEQGAWYDPSDFSTMFQDAAGSVPVTAVGQAVGRILDKSGRGNHATQTTSTKRPVLQQDANGKYYLLFDGIDDALQTASVNFTGTDAVTIWAGLRKLSDVSSGVLVELSINAASTSGCFVLLAPSSNGANSYRFFSSGTIAPEASAGTGTFAAAPDTAVITAIGEITPAVQTIRRNAAQVETTSSSQGTGNYSTNPLYIGSRAGISTFFNGRLYSLIIRGAQSTATQISTAEAYVNSRTGAY